MHLSCCTALRGACGVTTPVQLVGVLASSTLVNSYLITILTSPNEIPDVLQLFLHPHNLIENVESPPCAQKVTCLVPCLPCQLLQEVV